MAKSKMKPKKQSSAKKPSKKQMALNKKKINKLRELAFAMLPKSPESIASTRGFEIGTKIANEKSPELRKVLADNPFVPESSEWKAFTIGVEIGIEMENEKNKKTRVADKPLIPKPQEWIAFKTGVEIGNQMTRKKLKMDMDISKLSKLADTLGTDSPVRKSFHEGIKNGVKMILSTYNKNNGKFPEWKAFHDGVVSGIRMILKKLEKGGHI
ncbi:MAG: hypothetical protein HY840_15465 [Bacteroidetes bacterium]|nr:hypothetical protein [Bacteroidota bacterium]